MSKLTQKLSALLGRRKQPRLERAPDPSAIYEAVANLPRHEKRAHKLGVRREYRSRLGIMSSVDRQVLGKISMQLTALQRERQEAENVRYGAT